MKRPSIRTVVFDAVGTLIYPEPPVAQVYTAVGRRFGSKLAEAEVARRFRAAFAELEARDRAGDLATSEEVEFARWQHIVRTVLDDAGDWNGCFRELWEHFAAPSSWRMFPDVPEVISTLAGCGVHLAIASNFDRRLLEIVRLLDTSGRFHPVLVSSQIGYRKPHRRFFEAVLSAITCPPNEVLYVGDDLANDLSGAREAGIQTLLLDRKGRTDSGLISSLVDLLARLME